MKHRRVLFLSIGLAVLACVVSAFSETVESQNVVGFYKINISTNWNMISIPMQKLTVAVGQITPSGNVTATTIGDTSSSWVDGEFAWGVITSNMPSSTYNEAGKSVFYLEITGPTNSAFVGRHVYITNNLLTDLTIAGGVPADMQAGLANETYKIVPALRIRDVFGEPGSPKIKGASSLGAADKIYPFNAGGGYQAPVYYNTSFGMWIQGATPVDDKVIDRDEGLFVNRVATVSTNIVITGEVSANPQTVVMVPGWNPLGGQSVVDVTLNSTTLSNVLHGATSLGAADKIYGFNAGGGYQAPIYYNTSFKMWIQGATPVGDTYKLQASQGYFINIQSNGTIWVRPSPIQ